MSKPRLLNFRVSDEEYRAYCQACDVAGLPNLSELARVALRRYLDCSDDTASLRLQIRTLRGRIQRLAADIDQLDREIQARYPQIVGTDV